MKKLICIAILALAACENNGSTVRSEPEPKTSSGTGISISGSARVGVKKGG